MKNSCKNCRFYRGKRLPSYTFDGTCMRYPPEVVAYLRENLLDNSFTFARPGVNENEFCGEWEEREEEEREEEREDDSLDSKLHEYFNSVNEFNELELKRKKETRHLLKELDKIIKKLVGEEP